MPESLRDILSNIDWNASSAAFNKQRRRPDQFEKGSILISAWNYELCFYDRRNEANSFLQEMKASLFSVPACTSLGLIKPAAASLRTAVESALYYSFFFNHPAELETLHRDSKFYLSKTQIIEYHNTHSKTFSKRQNVLDLLPDLNSWYSKISSIIHGQIPGVWTSHSLKETAYQPVETSAILQEYKMAVKIINSLFLSTIPREVWEGLSSHGRQLFLESLSDAKVRRLGLSVV